MEEHESGRKRERGERLKREESVEKSVESVKESTRLTG